MFEVIAEAVKPPVLLRRKYGDAQCVSDRSLCLPLCAYATLEVAGTGNNYVYRFFRENILNRFIPALVKRLEWGPLGTVNRWQLPDALLIWKSREIRRILSGALAHTVLKLLHFILQAAQCWLRVSGHAPRLTCRRWMRLE